MSSSSVGRAFLALGASRWARRSRARLARSGVPTRRSVHRRPPHPPGALAVVAASAVDELRAEDTREALSTFTNVMEGLLEKMSEGEYKALYDAGMQLYRAKP